LTRKRAFQSIDAVLSALKRERYICDRRLAATLYLAFRMEKPLLLEGEPGVGKTEVAKVLAYALGRRLIRLQCYEGLDVNSAVYDWNYTKQILSIKMAESCGQGAEGIRSIFDESFLIQMPLLEAVRNEKKGKHVVLLIDELDRADEAFEAFLLEMLSEFQITIPEIGTLQATSKPFVVITSNRTRELHDAIKRRCLYHWIPYPSLEKEYEIVVTKVPEINKDLALKLCSLIQDIRGAGFYKTPGIAETLDWVQSLLLLHGGEVTPEALQDTFGSLFKCQEDMERVEQENLSSMWAEALKGASPREREA
jgi:MoxR-like ATPase